MLMKQLLKRFLVYLVIVSIFCFILFFLFKRYDFDWNTINWINSNRNYLLILCLSVVVCLSLRWNQDTRSKFMLYFIVCVNGLYLCFLFFVWNIWLSQMEWMILLAFLIFGFVGIYIKKWLWYTIVAISLVWSLIVLFLWSIPLFEKWPDLKWFEKSFENKMLIYSKFDISPDKAQIQKDDKTYNIYGWLYVYDLKTKDLPTQIVFKSDENYDNTYCFLVFKWWKFIELVPQSAVSISDNFDIDVLIWNVKYYNNIKDFSFVWWSVEKEISNNVINIVEDWYRDSLRIYLKTALWSDVLYNWAVLKISNKTLTFLSKIFPWEYDKNLKNLQEYVDIFWVDLDTKNDFWKTLNTKWVFNNIWWGVQKGIETID